ncbi:MAG: hypothetical protein KGQ37_12715 [Hyphomicrobiales bacterium]|nr:hypothetical protein [Hyphomicrobiales bacterium]
MLIFCDGPEALAAPRLVRALSSLVPGVVRGLIGDVHVVTPRAPAFAAIADEAGVAHYGEAPGEGAFTTALRALRGPWCVALRGDQRVDGGWFDALEAFIMEPPRSALLRVAPQNFAQHLLPGLAPASGIIWHQTCVVGPLVPSWAGLREGLRPRLTLAARTQPLTP